MLLPFTPCFVCFHFTVFVLFHPQFSFYLYFTTSLCFCDLRDFIGWNTSEFPVNLTPASWPCCILWITGGTWFSLTGYSELTIVSFYHLHAAPLIQFYNIMDIVLVTLVWWIFTFYLVALMQGFFGGLDPISSIRSTLALHLAFRFKLSTNIDKLAFEIVYLMHLLIY